MVTHVNRNNTACREECPYVLPGQAEVGLSVDAEHLQEGSCTEAHVVTANVVIPTRG
jgi:hypothetical protein